MAIRNGRGFKAKVMRFKTMARNMMPYYENVGFDFHGDGGQGGALNAPQDSQEDFLKCFNTVLQSLFFSSLLVGERVHAPGGSCASMLHNQHAVISQTCMHFSQVCTFVFLVWFVVLIWHTLDKNNHFRCPSEQSVGTLRGQKEKLWVSHATKFLVISTMEMGMYLIVTLAVF